MSDFPRTPIHKKHAGYPGMWISNLVKDKRGNWQPKAGPYPDANIVPRPK